MKPLAVATAVSMLVLAALCAAWETVLAPIRPGAWMLAIKALPLLLAVPGVFRQHRRTIQWWSMLILFYLAEGLVRGMTDAGLSSALGWTEAALAALIFMLILRWSSLARKHAESDPDHAHAADSHH